MESACKISSDLSSKILTIGPDYHNHRGGIGAVLEIYSRYYDHFKFLPTYQVGSSLHKLHIFIENIFLFVKLLITDRRIKIIHIHGASYGSFYRKFAIFYIAKFFFRKKIIYHIHGARFDQFLLGAPKPDGKKQILPWLPKILIGYMLKNIDIMICLSISWQKYFIESLNFPRDKCFILNNVIENSRMTLKSKINSPIKIVFLGEIGPRKGIFDVIKVIKKNKEIFSNEILLQIGGNGNIQELKSEIKLNQLNNIIEYIGWVNGEKKVEILTNADILILPSYAEGLPISILEGMSFGLPIIASNVGGIPEIVTDNVNGKLIEPGNLKQIELAILFFIENKHKIIDYGRNSCEIAKKYEPNDVFTNLARIYNKLL